MYPTSTAQTLLKKHSGTFCGHFTDIGTRFRFERDGAISGQQESKKPCLGEKTIKVD
jgi:hypothetical protein